MTAYEDWDRSDQVKDREPLTLEDARAWLASLASRSQEAVYLVETDLAALALAAVDEKLRAES